MELNFHSSLVRICLGLLILFACAADATDIAATSAGVRNIKQYGAVADGKTDSTKAIQQAWNEACAAEGPQQILIPEGDYLVSALIFKGPCKGNMTIELDGNLVAQPDHNLYKANWIDFQYVNGLTLAGKGKIDGQGALAWPHNQCPKKWDCKRLPMNLVFSFVSNATISGISSINSKFFHMDLFHCNNIDIHSITIDAPANSPNTDGIHVSGCTGVSIANSTIGTGDDCVSVGDKTVNLTVAGVTCGPGHGISIGSLGKNPGEGDVVGFTVKNCTITGTDNGVRIKTWQSKPSTASSNMKVAEFTFEDIVMNNVSNPIIIDQEYCPYAACPESDPSRVKISDITFRNIRGTYSSDHAIMLVCSAALPCEGVVLEDVNLQYIGNRIMQHANATSMCVNVKGLTQSNVTPDPCKIMIGASGSI